MEALLGEALRRRATLLLAAVVIATVTLSLAPTSLFGHSTNPLAIHMAHAKEKKDDKGKDKKKDK